MRRSGRNGRSYRVERSHQLVPGCSGFPLAGSCFWAPAPDDGTRGGAAPGRDNMPRTDEGRKGGTDGRKESVNDGVDTHDPV